MATGVFSSILDRKSGDVKRPPPFPTGTYVWVTKGLPEHGKSAQKLTPFVKFLVAPVAALDDVDQEALQAFGGIAGVTKELTFYDTEKSGYRLAEFLKDDLKIDDDDGEKGVRAMVDESPNHQFLGHVKHTPAKDGKGVFWEIDLTGPVES
jgi:hypothetical protein